MLIYRAYKTELDPNDKQRTWFLRCAGAGRYVFNWALADRIERYARGEKTNKFEQKRRFNSMKPKWLYETPFAIQNEEFYHVDAAYQNFFRRVKKGENPGFPKFKSRKKGIGTFTLRGSIHIESNRIKLPRIGWMRLKENDYLPVDGVKILSVTISEQAGRWFASAQVEQEIDEPVKATGETIGVDLGIKSLAIVSNGTVFENPKSYRKAERRLKKAQRELSRRKIGSRNREKSKRKLAKRHAHVANIRKHSIHAVTSYLVKTKPSRIVIEDLNVAGMLKNHCLAKSISDAGFGELRRQLEYKCAWNGIELVVADRFFPSSKMCGICGKINDRLTLADREWTCECGAVHDRDLNAARNLAKYAEPKHDSSACGATVQ